MLSVKLIEPSGHEQIYSVTHVTAVKDDLTGTYDVSAWRQNGDEPLSFGGHGDLYVMNENGKTVANYRLG
jgi:hypothetical protein